MAAHRRRGIDTRRRLVCALAIGLAGCVVAPAPLPPERVDPGATFVAHRVHGGFAVDRSGVGRGAIDAAAWRGSGPSFLVRADGRTLAALDLTGPASVAVRSAPGAPIVATVEPGWDDQAIRFALRMPDGSVLRTDTFQHVGGGAGASVLGRRAPTTLDLYGVYRAELRDAAGAPAGWFQVRLAPPAEPPIFEGVLPADAPLVGPAMVVALGSEIDWIEDHAIDVHRGTSGGRFGSGSRGR